MIGSCKQISQAGKVDILGESMVAPIPARPREEYRQINELFVSHRDEMIVLHRGQIQFYHLGHKMFKF
jgi:hypothetical protein